MILQALIDQLKQRFQHEKRTGPRGGSRAFEKFIEDLQGLADALDLHLELQAVDRDKSAINTLQAYRNNPPAAYDLKLKFYLPADLEDRLQARLEEAGIKTVDEEELLPSVLIPSRPGGLSPADIRKARQKAGWKQAVLADKVGVSQKDVSLWESAKKPLPKKREDRLLELLGGYL